MPRQKTPIPLAGIDLNLLLVLDALLSEGSVTAAAARIGLSQSATSHALARLRDLMGDPLLLRSSSGMVPTPRGRALARRVHGIIRECETTFLASPAFSPAESREEFRLSLDVSTQLNAMPRLMEAVHSEAPGLSLVAASPRPDTLARDLESGAIDFAITAAVPSPKRGLQSEFLLSSDYVTIIRSGNPLAGKRLTLNRFLRFDHIAVNHPNLADRVIDRLLAERSLERHVVLTLDTPGPIPALVCGGDYCATLPRMLVSQHHPKLDGLMEFRPPLELPPVQVFLISHERTVGSAAHDWLRSRIHEAFGSLG